MARFARVLVLVLGAGAALAGSCTIDESELRARPDAAADGSADKASDKPDGAAESSAEAPPEKPTG